jgi:hypothetical protein
MRFSQGKNDRIHTQKKKTRGPRQDARLLERSNRLPGGVNRGRGNHLSQLTGEGVTSTEDEGRASPPPASPRLASPRGQGWPGEG